MISAKLLTTILLSMTLVYSAPTPESDTNGLVARQGDPAGAAPAPGTGSSGLLGGLGGILGGLGLGGVLGGAGGGGAGIAGLV